MLQQKRILFFSDNPAIMDSLVAFADAQPWADQVDLACSPGGPLDGRTSIAPVKLKDEASRIVNRYGIVISGHCTQIFPASMVRSILCVNLHPGYNPESRGWYPQVFSIIYGHRIGFTVHVMSEEVDAGPIILREEVRTHIWDTSRTVYDRVVDAEIASIPRWLPSVIAGDFVTAPPEGPGNYFSKADFRDACELSLSETATFHEFYNRLRATSHSPYRNTFFNDPETGRKVFLRLDVEIQ